MPGAMAVDATKKAACYGYLLAFVDFRTMGGIATDAIAKCPQGMR